MKHAHFHYYFFRFYSSPFVVVYNCTKTNFQVKNAWMVFQHLKWYWTTLHSNLINSLRNKLNVVCREKESKIMLFACARVPYWIVLEVYSRLKEETFITIIYVHIHKTTGNELVTYCNLNLIVLNESNHS